MSSRHKRGKQIRKFAECVGFVNDAESAGAARRDLRAYAARIENEKEGK